MFQQRSIFSFSATRVSLTFSPPVFFTMACALNLFVQFDFELTLKTKCMKTIFTLFLSLIMSMAVFAAARPTSILTVKSADNADIRVVLDGKRFEPHDNSIMFGSMEPGRHSI